MPNPTRPITPAPRNVRLSLALDRIVAALVADSHGADSAATCAVLAMSDLAEYLGAIGHPLYTEAVILKSVRADYREGAKGAR